jgi:demethylmenaquinone methyltransferase/2-methoxy-6-polyprenyl-1,4-benzoquinol methylase
MTASGHFKLDFSIPERDDTMTVLPSAADKPRFVAAMFGRIAPRYDLMNTLMTGGQDGVWRRRVAALVGSADAVLDVGTGTGKLAATVARWLPDARVTGVDFSEPMLRAAPGGLPRAAADALRLPFGDASFDAVTSAFLVRNLADAAAGLAEQARVLRSGGRLVILETTPAPRGPLGGLFRLYFRRVVPLLGRLIAGDAAAYTYLPESSATFVEPDRLAAVLRQQRFTEVVMMRLSFGCVAIVAGRKP